MKLFHIIEECSTLGHHEFDEGPTLTTPFDFEWFVHRVVVEVFSFFLFFFVFLGGENFLLQSMAVVGVSLNAHTNIYIYMHIPTYESLCKEKKKKKCK